MWFSFEMWTWKLAKFSYHILFLIYIQWICTYILYIHLYMHRNYRYGLTLHSGHFLAILEHSMHKTAWLHGCRILSTFPSHSKHSTATFPPTTEFGLQKVSALGLSGVWGNNGSTEYSLQFPVEGCFNLLTRTDAAGGLFSLEACNPPFPLVAQSDPWNVLYMYVHNHNKLIS